MNNAEYWQWLQQFMTLLEDQARTGAEHFDEKMMAQLRIAERTLNFEIDRFMNSVEYHIEDMEGWNKLKNRRDALADTLSTMIESDPKLAARYQQYCENLKDHRSIGAML